MIANPDPDRTMPALIPDGAGGVTRAPVPRVVPAPGEVLIAVEAFGVNRGETFLLERPRAGWRPGQDVAGRVLEAPPGAAVRPGDPVVAHVDDGGWAPLVLADPAVVAARPEQVSATVAATLGVAGLTALRLVRAAGPLAGCRMLLTGASGGVGHFVTELAAAQGGHVTAVSRSAERGQRLLDLGAHRVVTDVGDADGPFDVVLESVGGPTLVTAMSRAQPHARIVWFGQAGREPATMDFFDLVGAAPGATIQVFSYWQTGADTGADLATLVDLVHHSRLHPEIGFVDDWSRTPEALQELLHRRVRGNVVLTVPDADRPH